MTFFPKKKLQSLISKKKLGLFCKSTSDIWQIFAQRLTSNSSTNKCLKNVGTELKVSHIKNMLSFFENVVIIKTINRYISSAILLTLIIFCNLLTGCANYPKEVELNRSSSNATSGPVLFIADPQIHNIYGRGLKQMLGLADLMSKVAVRQPELNILAPLVLDELIEKSINTSPPEAIIVLGDVTNIACSGEFDTYIESITSRKKRATPLIMAHGNHDSYLMGTVNYYFPVDCQANWKPKKMELSPFPTDESWWGPAEINSLYDRNWRDACYQPDKEGSSVSSPMNKSRWLSKYMDLLESFGMVRNSSLLNCYKEEANHYLLELSSEPQSILRAKNFRAKGIWYPPEFGDVPTESYFTGTYKSFIVQSLDVNQTRIVVIDTSVCEKAHGGWRFAFTNTGQHACLGKEQLNIIREIVADTPIEAKLVLAGHFPLKDLSKYEREELIKIASGQGVWTYMSAHSHKETSALDWKSGIEMNVGSTTDWPMESNLVWFLKSQANPPVTTIRLEQNLIPFKSIKINEASEVCRHLPAAKKLAELNPQVQLTAWESPPDTDTCDVSNVSSWRSQGVKLKKAISTIKERFKKEPLYRKALLSIAASASKYEYDSSDFFTVIP